MGFWSALNTALDNHSAAIAKANTPSHMSGRIAAEVKNQGKIADDNIALDSKPTTGHCGKSVAAALWTQRYFEHTLGWDFQAVWRWQAQENRPDLQAVGVAAAKGMRRQAERRAQAAAAEAQLAEAIRAHLWL